MRAKEFRSLITTEALRGEPVEPRCPHAEECGGCAFQHRSYQDQVAAKALVLSQLWADDSDLQVAAPNSLPSIDVVPSPDPYEYRTRMDYVATKGRFGLRKRGKFNYVIDLAECHLIPPPAFAAARALWLRAQELGIPDYNIRSHEGFLRYLVVRRSPPAAVASQAHGEQAAWLPDMSGQVLLAAVTAAGPYEHQMGELAALALAQPGVVGFHWLLNDTLTDLSFGAPVRHWGAATLPMQAGQHTLSIGPNTFFQNNVHLLGALLDDVLAECTRRPGEAGEAFYAPTVADLYGGVGTIALHIAASVGDVVSVESAGESAELAQENIALSGAGNLRAVAADVLTFLRQQQPRAFDVIVADPPRIGLGPEVCAELLRLAPRRIVYVSCNPLTQRDDVALLRPGYTLRSLRGYDMFPHTPHVEALGVLEPTSL